MKRLLKFIGWGILIGFPTLVLVFLTYAVTIALQQMPESAQIIQEAKQEEKPKEIPLVTSDEVEAKLNEFRASKGLPLFNTNVPMLDSAAQARVQYMCDTNDWTHNKAWDILEKYYNGSYIGENLYYYYKQENQAAHAILKWSESPGHLKNMVDRYTQVGIGVKYCPGFQGEPTAVIIVNYFGVPR